MSLVNVTVILDLDFVAAMRDRFLLARFRVWNTANVPAFGNAYA